MELTNEKQVGRLIQHSETFFVVLLQDISFSRRIVSRKDSGRNVFNQLYKAYTKQLSKDTICCSVSKTSFFIQHILPTFDSTMSSSKQLRIGVFMPSTVQLLDLATVDVLATMSSEYLGILPLPSHIGSMAPSTKITYITSPKLFPHVALTADLCVRTTHTYQDDDVAPGKLDIVVVPGTDPADSFEEDAKKWLRDQFNTEGVDVLCVCTGVFLCGAAGILDGKSVSGPRGLQDDLRKKYPNAKFVGEKYRWIQDGNLWSSGMFSLEYK